MSISTNVSQDEAPDHVEPGTQQQPAQSEELPDVQQSSSSSSATSAVATEEQPVSAESPVWLSPSQAPRSVISSDPLVSHMSAVFQQRMGAEPHTATLPTAPKTPTTQKAALSKPDPSTPIGLLEDEEQVISEEVPFVIKDLGDFGTAPPTPTPTARTNRNDGDGGEVLRDFSTRRPYMNNKMQGILQSRGLLDGDGSKKQGGDEIDTGKEAQQQGNEDVTTTTGTEGSESVKDSNSQQTQEKQGEQPQEEISLLKQAKKATVGVVGGAMTAVGLVMIPLPTPFGVVVAGSGLAVLGTEFPAAKQVLETSRDKLVEVIETHVVTDDDQVDEEGRDTKAAPESSSNLDQPLKTEVSAVSSRGSSPSLAAVSADDQDRTSSTPLQESGNGGKDATDSNNDDNDAGNSISSDEDDDSSNASATPAWLSNGPPSEAEFQKFSNRHPEVPPELQTSLEETWKKYRRHASRVARKAIPVLKKIGTTSASSSFDDGNSDVDGGSRSGCADDSASASTSDIGTPTANSTSPTSGETDVVGTTSIEPPSPQSRKVFV